MKQLIVRNVLTFYIWLRQYNVVEDFTDRERCTFGTKETVN